MRHLIPADNEKVPVASHLEVVGIEQHRGRCPWRLDYRVDGLPVRAFFRPPELISDQFTSENVSLIALPLACDLAAEVRARKVTFLGQCAVPGYTPVFRSATRALLVEQDAIWGRPRLTEQPSVERTRTSQMWPNTKVLDHNKVVLGFSGGKDSLVCLFSLIRTGYEVVPLLLNEGDRSWQDLRRWIPKLRTLGLQPMTAYLRVQSRAALRARYGHWYRSSYQIGWLSTLLALAADKVGAGSAALGLESSADRTGYRYLGVSVNHQHQKTTKHILAMQHFLRKTVNPNLLIASPIAPFSDGEVLRALFVGVPPSWRLFSSCGSANSVSKHCGACKKCAYIYAMLVRSLEGRRLAARIFRQDLFQNVDLYRPWLDGRYREPLGCIGERWELWSALEASAATAPSAPVIHKWLSSPFRQAPEKYRLPTKRRSGLNSDSSLAQPVYFATQAIDEWTKTRR